MAENTGVTVNVAADPTSTVFEPGETVPFMPTAGVMVYVTAATLAAKSAVQIELAFTTTVALAPVPTQLPDQPVNDEPALAAAFTVTLASLESTGLVRNTACRSLYW